MQRFVLLVALGIGITLGYVDSRPSWDDTAVMAFAILAAAAVLGALAPQRPWAIALAVGVWVPLLDILTQANYGSLLALAFAFAGAYAGSLLRRMTIAA
jgi:hypothetical protein